MRLRSLPSTQICCGCAIAIWTSSCSQPPPVPMSTQGDRSKAAITTYLASEAAVITDRALAESASQETWDAVSEQRREELREMLGLEADRVKSPLNVRITGTIERDGYVIEKVSFESLPNVYVTANLYLPTDQAGPVPGVIYVCGHAYSAHGAKTSYQRHGHTLAKHGYAALVIDPIQIAETAALHHGVLNQEMYEWYTRGYSPAGLEVWNVIRALDYLETRPEIDKDKFAITGRSGGAAMSWFSASVEPRLKVAIPVMGIATYAVTVPDNTQRRHCDCMYPVNFRGHDLLHLASLIAPRPLLMAHGRLDPLFPVAGYQQVDETMSSLYASYGVPERFDNIVVETGHADSDLLRAEAVKWLDRWLLEREPREIDTSFEEVDPQELAVFAGAPPADAENYRVHEFFIPHPEPVSWQNAADWNTTQEHLRGKLRDVVLGAIPVGVAPPATRPGHLEAPDGFESIAFDYDGTVPIEVLLHSPDDADGPTLLHVASPGEDPEATRQMLRNLSRFGRNPVMLVYPPGTGTGNWSKSDWKMLLRNAMHTGRTIDTIRIGGVLTAVSVLRQRIGVDRHIAVSGIGPAAGWALYAAVLDESISQAILVRAPASHEEGPVLLGALRHTDLPDVAALLAPRPLTFYGEMPESYSRTQDIYEGLGISDRLTISMSIGAALNGRFGHGFAIGL